MKISYLSKFLPNSELKLGEVHVWIGNLADLAWEQDRILFYLSQVERDRSQEILLIPKRQQFIQTRAILRILLGHYLGSDRYQPDFVYSANGKPALKGLDREPDCELDYPLRFNISHSQQLAAFAFCLDSEIGIDVEFLNPLRNFTGLSDRLMTTWEREAFLLLSKADQTLAFYNFWTRKEAIIKAEGEGIWQAKMLPQIPKIQTCLNFVPALNFVGAIAVEAEISNLKYYDYNYFAANSRQ